MCACAYQHHQSQVKYTTWWAKLKKRDGGGGGGGGWGTEYIAYWNTTEVDYDISDEVNGRNISWQHALRGSPCLSSLVITGHIRCVAITQARILQL